MNDSQASDDFEPIKHWGNEGPRYSLDAETFGLANATPVAPEGCDLTQVHLVCVPMSSVDPADLAALPPRLSLSQYWRVF